MNPRTLALAALPLLLTGCVAVAGGPGDPFASDQATVRIETDPKTCWTANVGMASHEGCGSKDFQVTDKLKVFSSSVQKTAEKGTVRISVVQDGEVKVSNETSAAYGIAMTGVGLQ